VLLICFCSNLFNVTPENEEYGKMIKFFIPFIITLSAFSAYHDTLPKGVRTFVYKRVQTDEVLGSYDDQGQFESLDQVFSLDASLASDIDEFKATVTEMKELAPDAYDKFSIGEFKLGAKANINADAFALGWGISDRITVYSFIPYMRASVQMDLKKTQENTYQEVGNRLRSNIDCPECQSIAQAVSEDIPNVTEENFQSIIVDELGYKPLGTWEGRGFGDAEIGIIYNFYKTVTGGSAAALGAVAPTGRVDNPDILQDLSFGDGQWDVFAELGGAKSFFDGLITLNAFSRFTYQIQSEKRLRVPFAKGLAISDSTGLFTEKLGNIILGSTYAEFRVLPYLYINPGFSYEKRFSSSYESSYANANNFLADNSDLERFSYKLQLELTTIGLYKNKKFPLPGKLIFGYQNTFKGTNTPKVSQLEAEVRLFF